MNGCGEDAVRALHDLARMKERSEVKLDGVTFVVLLSACNHSRMVPEGQRFFAEMLPVHGVEPKTEHYGCMVDLLCRAGLLNEDVRLVQTMPV